MQTAMPRVRRWTYDEFAKLADLDFFRGRRVELIGGRIIELAPQRDVHAAALVLALDALRPCYGHGFVIRPQVPLRMGKGSGPEPDLAVVAGSARDYVGTGHPSTALLALEISDSTLRYDRRTKGGLYAKYGIQNYWIVNLVDRMLEVYSQPVPDRTHAFRHRFDSFTSYTPGQSVAAPGIASQVQVSDLFP